MSCGLILSQACTSKALQSLLNLIKISFVLDPDPFAILSLDINSDINEDARNKAYRKPMPHVFERNALPPMTRGPTIPTWVQLNGARDQMGTPTMIKRLRERWLGISRPPPSRLCCGTWWAHTCPREPRSFSRPIRSSLGALRLPLLADPPVQRGQGPDTNARRGHAQDHRLLPGQRGLSGARRQPEDRARLLDGILFPLAVHGQGLRQAALSGCLWHLPSDDDGAAVHAATLPQGRPLGGGERLVLPARPASRDVGRRALPASHREADVRCLSRRPVLLSSSGVAFSRLPVLLLSSGVAFSHLPVPLLSSGVVFRCFSHRPVLRSLVVRCHFHCPVLRSGASLVVRCCVLLSFGASLVVVVITTRAGNRKSLKSLRSLSKRPAKKNQSRFDDDLNSNDQSIRIDLVLARVHRPSREEGRPTWNTRLPKGQGRPTLRLQSTPLSNSDPALPPKPFLWSGHS